MNGKYEMWPLFHLGAIWRNFIFSDRLFSLRVRVLPLFSRLGGKINANPGKKNTRILFFLPLGGKKTGCTSAIFSPFFVFWHDFMADCWKTRVFPSAQ
jgi:hypothetical protein